MTKPPRSFAQTAFWWTALLAVSLAVAMLLKRTGLPAAYLIGPMLCGIAFSLADCQLALPRRLFQCAQALIGCAVATSITSAIVLTVGRDWPVIVLVVAGAVLSGGLVGWTLTRTGLLPGTTAAWGSTPGGASAMVAMAGEYGADVRLVALMQYLRVLVVVLSASLISRYIFASGQTTALAPALDAHPFSWTQLLITLALAVFGGALGVRLKLPAGAMLVPMLVGAVLHSTDVASVYQPVWLSSIASLLLGWFVGLGFSRDLLLVAWRMLPVLLLSSVLLIGLCALLGWLLVIFLHTDPLTAYLATTPGGIDSVILIALGSAVDIPFVVAVQTLRLFALILLGPAIARLICRYA